MSLRRWPLRRWRAGVMRQYIEWGRRRTESAMSQETDGRGKLMGGGSRLPTVPKPKECVLAVVRYILTVFLPSTVP